MDDVLSCYNLAEEYISTLETISKDSPDDQDVVNASPMLVHAAVSCYETGLALISQKVGGSDLVQWELVLRYRLSQVLLHYTTNYSLAEKFLSKGILLADRNELAVFKLELQLLMIQLLHKMKHMQAAITSADSAIRHLSSGSYSHLHLSEPETEHFKLGYMFMKIVIDPERCSSEFQALEGYDPQKYPGVSASAAIIQALFCIKNYVDYPKASAVLEKVASSNESGDEQFVELRVLRIMTLIFAYLGSGKLLPIKPLITQLHKCLDRIDWKTWRPSVAIGPSSYPVWVSVWSQEQIMLNTFLVSGIYYLLTGKISLALKFLQQGQSAISSYSSSGRNKSLAVSFNSYSCLLNFYLSLAYFQSSQWNLGYKTMKPYLKLFPKALSKYLCGVYFQATGKLDQAKTCYLKVLSLEGGKERRELNMLTRLNLAVMDEDVDSWKQVATEFSQVFRANEQLQLLDLVIQDPRSVDISTGTSYLGSQLKSLVLCLSVQNSPHNSSQSRVALSKEAHSESLKAKNWLWSWISGSILHQTLVDNGNLLTAEAQMQNNMSFYAGLERLFSGK